MTLNRNSPKQLAWFQEFQSEDASSLRPLCPTRWTVKAASLQSVASNYSALIQFLEELSSENTGDANDKANGLLTYYLLADVDIFSACRNGQCHTAKQPAAFTESFPAHLHGNGFEDFWKNTNAANLLNMEEPVLPRP